jgi:hypothetical protein
MTRSKSTFSRSSKRAWSKLSVSFSPKKVMSGFVKYYLSAYNMWTDTRLAFMIPGGKSGSSLSSDSALSHPSFFLPFRFDFSDRRACFDVALQAEQTGTFWLWMSFSISEPGTCLWQLMQDAVANEPWHWRTRETPASVSRVSIFCV